MPSYSWQLFADPSVSFRTQPLAILDVAFAENAAGAAAISNYIDKIDRDLFRCVSMRATTHKLQEPSNILL
jgi:hypothetical protein